MLDQYENEGWLVAGALPAKEGRNVEVNLVELHRHLTAIRLCACFFSSRNHGDWGRNKRLNIWDDRFGLNSLRSASRLWSPCRRSKDLFFSRSLIRAAKASGQDRHPDLILHGWVRDVAEVDVAGI